MQLDDVMIFADDLATMTAFYRDVVGLPLNEATRRNDWVEFETGNVRFALHAIPAQASRDIDAGAPPAPREQQAFKLIFRVADIDAALARLEGLGVRILRRPWGGWDFVDPEGNVLGVRATAA
jgi:catechol 2,3-dioxygenase-like lactoylglutathione lyase family enzyme